MELVQASVYCKNPIWFVRERDEVGCIIRAGVLIFYFYFYFTCLSNWFVLSYEWHGVLIISYMFIYLIAYTVFYLHNVTAVKYCQVVQYGDYSQQ